MSEGIRIKSIFFEHNRPVGIGGRVSGRVVIFLVLLWLIPGCGPPRASYPAALMSENPTERASAIKHAAEIRDRSVMNLLVDRLEDEDEAVRMFAIMALEKLTGQRQGYEYHACPADRWRAVQRWRRYLAESSDASGESGGG